MSRRIIIGDVLIVLSCLAGGLVVLQRMGTDLFSACDSSCISANESNMGGLFLAALIVGNVVLVGLRLNRQHAALKGLKIVLGVSAVLAFFVMMNRRTFCTYCALAQVSWFLLAIDSLFSFHRTLALLALAIPIGWIASSIWPVVGHGNAPPVIFELRDYDRIDRSLPYAMVIFGDPLCPHCRAAEAAMLKKAPPVPVLHRWKLLSQNGEKSVRLAAAIESAMRSDAAKGQQWERQILSSPDSAKTDAVLNMAVQAGFSRQQAQGWLDDPESQSLELIRQDGELASTLGVRDIPAIGRLQSMPQDRSPNIRLLDKKGLSALAQSSEKELNYFDFIFIGDMDHE